MKPTDADLVAELEAEVSRMSLSPSSSGHGTPDRSSSFRPMASFTQDAGRRASVLDVDVVRAQLAAEVAARTALEEELHAERLARATAEDAHGVAEEECTALRVEVERLKQERVDYMNILQARIIGLKRRQKASRLLVEQCEARVRDELDSSWASFTAVCITHGSALQAMHELALRPAPAAPVPPVMASVGQRPPLPLPPHLSAPPLEARPPGALLKACEAKESMMRGALLLQEAHAAQRCADVLLQLSDRAFRSRRELMFTQRAVKPQHSPRRSGSPSQRPPWYPPSPCAGKGSPPYSFATGTPPRRAKSPVVSPQRRSVPVTPHKRPTSGRLSVSLENMRELLAAVSSPGL